MAEVSVAEAKAHLSALLERVERVEEIVITRRGKPVARVSALQPPPQPIDWARINAIRELMPFQEVPSVELIRRMRDEKY